MCCLAMFECFLRSLFDLGLSCVDADEPETSEGVRAGSETGGRTFKRAFVPDGEEMAFVYLV